jgi:hypothetical protein
MHDCLLTLKGCQSEHLQTKLELFVEFPIGQAWELVDAFVGF